jgi:hypothetical protein
MIRKYLEIGRRALVCATCFFAAGIATGPASSAESPKKFIPWSPLSAEQTAEQKAKLQKTTGLTDTMIDNLLKDESNNHTYRDEDIVAAFPELRGARKISECSNRMMSGAAELVFLAETREHEVTIEKLSCSAANKGLECEPVKRGDYAYLESPENYFSLEGLTLAAASTILDAYEAGRILNLPAFFHGARPAARSIAAQPDGTFRMSFGDYFCTGCAMTFNVRIEGAGERTRLAVVGEPQGGCY